ncbi:MAG TPA: DsbA family protein [Burkholderiaceae bacterium]|nr:DsbA family protein [Burkholderiaceae bacterium]
MSDGAALLVYVADPMCSWCYGFAPELHALQERLPQVPVVVVTGGLRAFNTQRMDAQLKDFLRHHWEEVAQRSGQPFSHALLERDDFVYDTEPACRAVVTVREHDARLALPMLHAVQRAFYAAGLDVTRGEVLADVYAELCAREPSDFDPTAFYAAWAGDAMKQATLRDFEMTQEWGIRGFPTLIAVRDGEAHLIANGYMKAGALADRTTAALEPRR